MPSTNPYYLRENNDFINDAWECLKQINKNLNDKDLIDSYCNRYIFAQPICEIEHLKKLIQLHALETNSPISKKIIKNFENEINNFVQVCPKEMLDKLENPISNKKLVVQAS